MNERIINQEDAARIMCRVRKLMDSDCECTALLSSYGVRSKDACFVSIEAIKDLVESRIKPTSISKDFRL